jgi:hypothetical protein
MELTTVCPGTFRRLSAFLILCIFQENSAVLKIQIKKLQTLNIKSCGCVEVNVRGRATPGLPTPQTLK